MAISLNELQNQGMQQKFAGASITSTSPDIVKAGVVKQVIKDLLWGENIPDIKAELNSRLMLKNFQWENNQIKETELIKLVYFIQNYINFEFNTPSREDKNYFLPDDDTTVIIDGKEVNVPADYYIDYGTYLTITRIKTGKPPKFNRHYQEQENKTLIETYGLGMLGKKIAAGQKPVKVEYIYLQEDEDIERQNQAKHRQFKDTDKVQTYEFTDVLETKLASDIAAMKGHGCENGCAGCPMTNICNYVEPPITLKVEKTVKPISEIHLTGDQKAIEQFTRGNARVNAGPGSGKTLVTAMHVKYLLEHGYNPEDIGIFTFTRTGAEEMTARTIQYCAADGILIEKDQLMSTTFNSFCQKIIDTHYEQLGYAKSPRVIPDSIKYNMINDILDRFDKVPEWKYVSISYLKKQQGWMKHTAESTIAISAAMKMFTAIKSQELTRENIGNVLSGYSEKSIELIFQMYDYYQDKLKERCLIDYEDQLILVNKLYANDPDLFKRDYPYKAIIVDEFQDTDPKQIELLLKMKDTLSFEQFMAIGDDTQSIFAFRGTSPEFMINFGQYFGQNFTNLSLIDNHRSTGNIIKMANEIAPLDTTGLTKTLTATKEMGAVPIVNGYYTPKQEYEETAKEIKRLIDEQGVIPSDIAFIAHNASELKRMAEALTNVGVSSIMMNPIPYKENARVAALCSFFESYISNGKVNQGLIDYENVLRHGALKGYTGEELESLVAQFADELRNNKLTIEHFKEYAKALDLNETDECFQQFLEKNIEWCNSMDELKEFFRCFDLYGDKDTARREGKYEGVSLITVHSAKGLEWDNVFFSLDNIDSKSFHQGSQKPETYYEAIRKWFVGVTRARSNLHVIGTYCIASGKDSYTENEFLHKSYDMINKTWGYNRDMELYIKNVEKQEQIEEQNRQIRERMASQGMTSQIIIGAMEQAAIDRNRAQARYSQITLPPAQHTPVTPQQVSPVDISQFTPTQGGQRNRTTVRPRASQPVSTETPLNVPTPEPIPQQAQPVEEDDYMLE